MYVYLHAHAGTVVHLFDSGWMSWGLEGKPQKNWASCPDWSHAASTQWDPCMVCSVYGSFSRFRIPILNLLTCRPWAVHENMSQVWASTYIYMPWHSSRPWTLAYPSINFRTLWQSNMACWKMDHWSEKPWFSSGIFQPAMFDGTRGIRRVFSLLKSIEQP